MPGTVARDGASSTLGGSAPAARRTLDLDGLPPASTVRPAGSSATRTRLRAPARSSRTRRAGSSSAAAPSSRTVGLWDTARRLPRGGRASTRRLAPRASRGDRARRSSPVGSSGAFMGCLRRRPGCQRDAEPLLDGAHRLRRARSRPTTSPSCAGSHPTSCRRPTSSRSRCLPRSSRPGKRHERRLPLRRRQHAARQRSGRRRPARPPRRRGRRGLRTSRTGSSSRSSATELGYADYLGALQRYRDARPRDLRILTVSHFLVSYPFANRLFPGSLDALDHCATIGATAILSDGDVVFQPRKISRSGLYDAVGGRVLVYIHKEHELDDVEERLPADHYVLVDDKVRILAAVKAAWGSRVTTVWPRPGPLRARRRRRRPLSGARPHDRADRRPRRAPPRRARRGRRRAEPGTATSRRGGPARRRGGKEKRLFRR